MENVAHTTERVRARRLARQTGLTEAQALQQILIAAAAPLALATLIALRQAERDRDLSRRTLREHNRLLARAEKSRQPVANNTDWLAWFDGSALPNPGRIGLGGVLHGLHGQRWNFSLRSDYGDNSQAEYLALLGLLELAVQHNATPLRIFGDSKVVLDDLSGLHGVAHLATYRTRARFLLAQCGAVRCQWIPRQKNVAADLLARQARSGLDGPMF